MGERKRRHLPS